MPNPVLSSLILPVKNQITGVVTNVEYDLLSGSSITSVSCNGVEQTVSSGAVNIDVASNLVTEAQWTQIQTLLS